MVSESETRYMCNLEIHMVEGKKLQETILSVLQPYLGHGTIFTKTIITTVCPHLKYC